MRPGSRPSVFFAFSLALAPCGLAQDTTTATVAQPSLRHRLRDCLVILDLTNDEKTGIENVFAAARPTVQSDVAAVKAARQTLKTDLEAATPNACTIGADALALKSARETLRSERQTVLNQILALLRPDQQSRLQGCLDAPFPDASGSPDESSD